MKTFFLSLTIYFLTNLPALAEKLPNPLGKGVVSPQQVASNLVQSMFAITGILATLVFIWGGLLWTSSGGSKERIKKGKDVMVWAIIGLIVTFASYAIINTVLRLIYF